MTAKYKEKVVVQQTHIDKYVAETIGYIVVDVDKNLLEPSPNKNDNEVLVHFGSRGCGYIPVADIWRDGTLLPDDDADDANLEKVGAIKDNSEKVDLSLLPWRSLSAIAQAFEIGEKKYGRDNYRKEPKLRDEELLAAAMGHIGSHADGEEIDGDSGLPHLYLAGASILILLDQTVKEPIRKRFER